MDSGEIVVGIVSWLNVCSNSIKRKEMIEINFVIIGYHFYSGSGRLFQIIEWC